MQWSCASVTTHGCPSNVACVNVACGSTMEYNRRSPDESSQNNFFGTAPLLTNRIVLGVDGAADFNDGTPLKSVDVKVDNGPWQAAAIQTPAGKFAWKYFTYTWSGATPGEHTIVSRATDRDGYVQPELLAEKKTFLEDNTQFPRKVMIA